MIHIIPAILAKDEADFLVQLTRVRSFAPKVHIDVMDGTFVPHQTWAPPEKMRQLLDGLPFEVHLMVSNPEHLAPVWIAAGAELVSIHAESTTREQMICRATSEDCSKLSLAINPETPISHVIPDLEAYEGVTVMSVPPGKSGQTLDDIALEKIRAIKSYRPGVTVCIDGGIKADNVRRAVEAGAEHIVVGSAIMKASNPEEAYRQILEAATQPLNDETKPDKDNFTPPPEPKRQEQVEEISPKPDSTE